MRLFAPILAAAVCFTSFPALAETFGKVKLEIVAEGLEHPWGLAQLPSGDWLITERPGRVRILANGRLSDPLKGAPITEGFGQGGMLDVALDPNFSANGRVYFSFAHIENGRAGTAVARAELQETNGAWQLANTTTLYSMTNKTSRGQHFGSRIVFQNEDTFWLTIGDRGNAKDAQDPLIAAGSILRLKTDGSIPEDNPFLGDSAFLPELWSIGHRNPQGAAKHPETGALWTVEHGARGGDEINQPAAGKNYGWPEISYGRHYSGLRIGSGTEKDGLEQPLYYWDPSIAPSGMAFYTGTLFPEWQGDVFVGALKFRKLVRLDLENGEIVGEEDLIADFGQRIRAVAQGQDGAIYILTDSPNGVLARLTPAP